MRHIDAVSVDETFGEHEGVAGEFKRVGTYKVARVDIASNRELNGRITAVGKPKITVKRVF